MTEPMSDERLAEIRDAFGPASVYLSGVAGDGIVTMGNQLLAEVDRLRAFAAENKRLADELAEERAAHNPMLRCLLLKAAPDRDLYVGWSNIVEAPTGVWTRAEAEAYGFPPSRLDRADARGTSSRVGDGAWDDKGLIAEQRGFLPRESLGDYALAYRDDDMDRAFDLLEPFEGETEVRRD